MYDSRRPIFAFLFAGSVILLSVLGCSAERKALKQIKAESTRATLALPAKQQREFRDMKIEQLVRDTLVIHDYNGKDVFVMNAIRDDETGEMVANEMLAAAVISAQFRNVAERHGEVDLEFQVKVPPMMVQSDWQLRLYPRMYIFDECTDLEPVVITGDDFRKGQIKGYKLYDRYISGIIKDTSRLVNIDQLEFYLKREFPDLYALKGDTTFVDDDYIKSIISPEEQKAVEHYTLRLLARRNNKRRSDAPKKYQQFIKSPIGEEGLRLDTVVVSQKGNFIFNYIETIKTRPKFRRADIVLSGEIISGETGKRIYNLPKSDSLTFYISSVSMFLDSTIVRYKYNVIERKASADASYNIGFDVSKTRLDEDFGDNRATVRQIKEKLKELMLDEVYDLDSIVVTAASSPEGGFALNEKLSLQRSESITDYFSQYVREFRDSVERDSKEGIHIVLDESLNEVEGENEDAPKLTDIRFISRSIAENWDDLIPLVEQDTLLTEADKEDFHSMLKIKDPDRREYLMRIRKPWYSHMKTDLYPKVRTVHFGFAMHRKGMVKDTIHTREIDMDYKRGVQALENRDYETAYALLSAHNDYNTAIAAMNLGRNYQARDILRKCEMTDKVHYLLAIVYSRLGDPELAVQHYMESCRLNQSFVFRGNLDPEIYMLIKQYNLNAEPEDDFDWESY